MLKYLRNINVVIMLVRSALDRAPASLHSFTIKNISSTEVRRTPEKITDQVSIKVIKQL